MVGQLQTERRTIRLFLLLSIVSKRRTLMSVRGLSTNVLKMNYAYGYYIFSIVSLDF